jgi:hypothetical protein
MFSHPVTVGELLIGLALLALGWAALAWWTAGQDSEESREELEAMGDTYNVTHQGHRIVDLKKR